MDDLTSGGADSTPSIPSGESTPAPTIESVFADAEREVSAATSTPETPDPAMSTGEAPTTAEPSQEATPQAAAPVKEGPIPFQVHKTALENARTKERESVIAQVQQEMAPIRSVLPVAQAIAQDVQSGSIDGLNQLLKEYAQHPQLGPQLRSMFGRALSQMRGQTPAAQDMEPEPDLQTSDGTPVYSAPQLAKWNAWNKQRLKEELGQEFAPLRELQGAVTQTQELKRQTDAYVQRSTPFAEQLMAMPGFEDHKQAIATKQQELWKATPSADPMALWFKAYNAIVPPKLQAQHQQHQQQQETNLVQQAGRKLAASTANPSAGAATQPRALRVQGRSQSAVIDDIFDQVGAELTAR
jgi:hypothetical protein